MLLSISSGNVLALILAAVVILMSILVTAIKELVRSAHAECVGLLATVYEPGIGRSCETKLWD